MPKKMDSLLHLVWLIDKNMVCVLLLALSYRFQISFFVFSIVVVPDYKKKTHSTPLKETKASSEMTVNPSNGHAYSTNMLEITRSRGLPETQALHMNRRKVRIQSRGATNPSRFPDRVGLLVGYVVIE
jgi:hypothetical protein